MRVTISNVFGSSNRGDALLVEALHAAILEGLGRETEVSGIAHFPELEREHLPSVSWSPPPARSYAPVAWQRRAMNGLRLTGTHLFAASGAPKVWPIGLPPRAQRESVYAIKNADLVISCAGGFLLDVNASILGNLTQLHLANHFKTPVILAPQTIGPIRSKSLRNLTARVLGKAKLICARERFTYEFLIDDLGLPESKVLRTTDIAFEHGEVDRVGGVAALRELGISIDDKFIGATIVDWPFPSSSDKEKSRSEYKEKIVYLLKRLYDNTGRRIVIFNQVSSDLRLSEEIAYLCGKAVVHDGADRSTAVMRGMLERADAFIGSRFHSCVFALLGGVPTAALAYTYKSTGIMEDLDLSEQVWDIDQFVPENIEDFIYHAIEHREAESSKVRAAVTGLKFPRFSEVLKSIDLS